MAIRALVLQDDGRLCSLWRDAAGTVHTEDTHPPISALGDVPLIPPMAGPATVPSLLARQDQIVTAVNVLIATVNTLLAALAGRT